MSREKVKGVAKLPPSTADEADQKALDRAVETMIENVLKGWDHGRSLGSLNKADLRRLAESAITGFILGKAEWDVAFRQSGRLSDVGFAEPI